MSISEKDSKFVWHPFTQEKTSPAPIPIVKAKDSWLFDEKGKKYLDVNSSWWTNIHGHGNEYIANKIKEQFLEIDHVVFAGITHPKAVELAERIIGLLLSNFQKVFFSDNGSTSVEVALKMAFQYHFNLGQTKTKILALEGSYHGDTFGAMSVSQRDYFNKPFEHLFFEVEYLPFPNGENEEEILKLAEQYFQTNEYAAFIFEPLVQGAAGMRIYKSDILNNLILLSKKHNVITIADEVMTGFYRTGTLFAINQLNQIPDIICLSKGLTGGVLPLGLTVATDQIYQAFYRDEAHKALLHGHSFTGNALSCAAACASLDLIEETGFIDKINLISQLNLDFIASIKNHPKLKDARCLGTIAAIEINDDTHQSYFSNIREKAFNYFIKNELYIRPLGNVIFINPPYSTTKEEMKTIHQKIKDFIHQL